MEKDNSNKKCKSGAGEEKKKRACATTLFTLYPAVVKAAHALALRVCFHVLAFDYSWLNKHLTSLNVICQKIRQRYGFPVYRWSLS